VDAICDDAEDLIRLVELNNQVPRGIRVQVHLPLSRFDAFEQQMLPDTRHDNLVVSNRERAVDDDHISCTDTRPRHLCYVEYTSALPGVETPPRPW